LRAIEHLKLSSQISIESRIVFTHYAQSNHVNDERDSSVSYAAAYLSK